MAQSQNTPRNALNSLFGPRFLDDPEALAQLASSAGIGDTTGITGPAPSPSGIAGAPNAPDPGPVQGVVPKSFNEWAQDPINLAKIPRQINNSPLPGVGPDIPPLIARPSGTQQQPYDPMADILAGPLSQANGGSGITPVPQRGITQDGAQAARGITQGVVPATAAPAPSIEDLLFAPSTPSPATTPAAPAPLMSRQDFFANPANAEAAKAGIPLPPHKYGTRGSIAMALATIGDTMGAALSGGTPTVGKHWMEQVAANQEYQRTLPVMTQQAKDAIYEKYLNEAGKTAQIGDIQSQEALRLAQTNQIKDTVQVQVPDGKGGYNIFNIPQKDVGKYVTGQTAAAAKVEVAHIAANNQAALQQFKADLDAGKIAFTKPVPDGHGGSTWAAYNKQGELLKTLDGTIGPAWLQPTTRSGVVVKPNAYGGYDYIPVSSTTRRLLPDGQAPAPQAPQNAPTPSGAVPPVSAGAPSPTGQPQPLRGITQPPTQRGISQGGVRAVPGSSSPKSIEQGYAFNPQTGEWNLASRADAPGQGLQNWYPVKAQRIADDKSLNNQLSDVVLKTNEYMQSRVNPAVTEDDRDKMRLVLRSDHFKLGAFGMQVPVDQVNRLLASNRIGDMSPAGKQALVDYYNARESLAGYNRVLTGSSRNNEKQMQLALDALPAPDYDTDFVKKGIQRFQENINTVGQGIPRIPGVRAWRDVQQGQLPAGMPGSQSGNQSPTGGIQPGAIAQHADGSEWKFNGGNSADIRNWTQTKAAPRR